MVRITLTVSRPGGGYDRSTLLLWTCSEQQRKGCIIFTTACCFFEDILRCCVSPQLLHKPTRLHFRWLQPQTNTRTAEQQRSLEFTDYIKKKICLPLKNVFFSPWFINHSSVARLLWMKMIEAKSEGFVVVVFALFPCEKEDCAVELQLEQAAASTFLLGFDQAVKLKQA